MRNRTRWATFCSTVCRSFPRELCSFSRPTGTKRPLSDTQRAEPVPFLLEKDQIHRPPEPDQAGLHRAARRCGFQRRSHQLHHVYGQFLYFFPALFTPRQMQRARDPALLRHRRSFLRRLPREDQRGHRLQRLHGARGDFADPIPTPTRFD